jgi:hypothetical protein
MRAHQNPAPAIIAERTGKRTLERRLWVDLLQSIHIWP